jgi:hypothetical protein
MSRAASREQISPYAPPLDGPPKDVELAAAVSGKHGIVADDIFVTVLGGDGAKRYIKTSKSPALMSMPISASQIWRIPGFGRRPRDSE